MKSTIITSALFASVALAAPLNKRVLATKTSTVMETVVVYTTIWEGEQPAPPTFTAAASNAALFFEKPAAPAAVTSAAVPEAPKPALETSSTSSTAPAHSVQAVTSSPPTTTPTPVVNAQAAPAPEVKSTTSIAPSTGSSSSSGSSGTSYTGSLTMNYYKGGTGACGDNIQDTDMVAALAVPGFGSSTFDPATGKPTNKWCNQKIRVTYNGKSADAVIKDRCPGCTGTGGLDATPALWAALTGGQGGAAGDRLESGMSFTLIN